jgi:hypothetical protein
MSARLQALDYRWPYIVPPGQTITSNPLGAPENVRPPFGFKIKPSTMLGFIL